MSPNSSNPEEQDILRRQLGYDRSSLNVSTDQQEEREDVPDELPLGLAGACAGFPIKTFPNRFFIAQEFRENDEDFRDAVEGALRKFNLTSIRADDFQIAGHISILCKIWALIRGTDVGIYQLSTSQNRNVYLELGIAIGLRKPFILVKERNAEVPEIIGGLEYFPIQDYLKVQDHLSEKLQHYILYVAGDMPVDKPISILDAVVIVHGNLEPFDITVTWSRALAKRGFRTLIAGSFSKDISERLNKEGISYEFLQTREAVMNGVQGASFGIYRVDREADASSFVALGMAYGGNKHALLMHNSRNPLPSDLNGLELWSFTGRKDLETIINLQLDAWLAKHSFNG